MVNIEERLNKLKEIQKIKDFWENTKSVISEIRRDNVERKNFFNKKGENIQEYKKIHEEVSSIRYFTQKHKEIQKNSDHWFIQPTFNNSDSDAVIFDEKQNKIFKIEITEPRDGKKEAEEFKKLAKYGIGNTREVVPGRDTRDPAFWENLKISKWNKDYSDSILVIVISLEIYFQTDKKLAEDLRKKIISEGISFIKNNPPHKKPIETYILFTYCPEEIYLEKIN